MRRLLYASAFLATAAAAFFAPDAAAYINPSNKPATSSVVKVIVSDGHGSAVHIGNGSFLTSTHVVEGKKTVSLKTSSGKTLGARVLWSNKEYEIAMLTANGAGVDVSNLTCREAEVGEPIRAVGNPIELEFVSAWGRISGARREIGPLKSAYVSDLTTVMGMSGGPVFDMSGDIIGINAAVQLASIEGSTTLTGFGFVVPSKDICALLGRAA
ncbi:serine protease [Sinorhizobium sp. BJ1]|uniref:S1C family serine protease n=1 Tax=Sinorhizobium sp. BJ1 TaxID=2035455 RepID=UPI000BE79B3A|nr:serine protease [Sinorhizobium sp. BJ1]PDT79940.1 serine protease [Sinorhizobium sp. BJ1]